MRSPSFLYPLIASLLAFLLLSGCVRPATISGPAPLAPTVSLTLSVNLQDPAYQPQHTIEDIGSLVVGLVDLSAAPYFGYVGTEALDPAKHAFHPILRAEALVGDLGLPDPGNPKRYFYATTTDRRNLKLAFDNVRPSDEERYVAFVAAFSKNSLDALTPPDLIGFHKTPPFKVLASGTTVNLPMTLNHGLRSLRVVVNFDEPERLPDTSSLVIGLMDASTRQPYFGARFRNDLKIDGPFPGYHETIFGQYVNGAWEGAKALFDFGGTEIEGSAFDSEKVNPQRVLYYEIVTGPDALPGKRAVTFGNLKQGAQYYAFAVALKDADVPMGYDQSVGLTVSDALSQTTNLLVPLND